MIKAIAIDDEPVALDIIKTHAASVPFLELMKTFNSAAEALAYLEEEDADLIFLDIQMPDISGLEFAARLKPNVQVVFITAYPDYAIDGFELAATDYLLKPVTAPRFLQACLLAENRARSFQPKDGIREEFLFIKDGYKWVRINLDNLLYIKGEDNYAALVEKDRRTLSRITLGEIMQKLPKSRFLRVHKSYIAAIPKIDKAERHQLIIAGHKIPVSEPYRDSVTAALSA